MDEKSFLILIKIKGRWVDKTASIISVDFQENTAKVTFNNNKAYPYNVKNVKFFDQPEIIDISRNIITVSDDTRHKNFEEVIKFENYFCLFHQERKILKDQRYIQINDNLAFEHNSQNLIQYYTAIADLSKNGDKDGEGEGLAHLSYYYQTKLSQISKDAVLNQFINGSAPNPESEIETIIHPFGVNTSQRIAVRKALTNQISLIQGPPGTGKTQTILNIIANLVMQNKSVAVVAGNNSAVANVYEKLEKEQLSFIAAKLGKTATANEFMEQDHPIPDLASWELPDKQRDLIKTRLVKIDKNIDILLKAQNSLAKEKAFLRNLKLEKYYFQKNFDYPPFEIKKYSFLNKWKTPELLKFITEFEHYKNNGKIGAFIKFLWLCKYRIYKFDDFDASSEDSFKRLVSEYYLKRTIEAEEKIQSLEQLLERRNFNKLLAKQTEYSIAVFKDQIAKKYSQMTAKKFGKTSYKGSEFSDFINRFPVVMSTTDSIINNKPSLELFDYVIVDEASQVNLLAGFLTMACAKNIIVVGDLKQLPHISQEGEKITDLAQKYNVSPCYNYENENLLSSLDKLFDKIPKTLLREHYRCHPQIIDYCNQKFYDGKLIVMTEGTQEPFSIIKTVKGNHAGKPSSGEGYINYRELDVIEKEILPKEIQHTSVDNIGIITPYRSQANLAHNQWKNDGIEVNTVHKFQGREKDTIIFSTTANKITKFMDQPKLLNVTVSRAKNRFVMVTSSNIVKQYGSNIGDLIRHIEYQSPSSNITESKLISIFDCLYSEFSVALKEFRSKVKRYANSYLSEDLMSSLLDELLSSDQYASFSYKKNYPLSFLVGDQSLFNEREKKFTNSSSHIDFLIYSKLDKLPVIAIEVDGYSTHDLNDKQLERDKVKNSILEKIELPLLRFSTKGSDERQRLKKALCDLIGF